MNTIEEDIDLAKMLDTGLRAHRLAVEVERLRAENLSLRVKLNSDKIAELE